MCTMDINATTTKLHNLLMNIIMIMGIIFCKMLKFHSNLETLKLGNNGSFHTSMRMRRRMSKLSLMVIFQELLPLHNFSKKLRSHSNSVTQKLGSNGSSHTSMRMRRKTSKLSSIPTSQDQLVHHSSSRSTSSGGSLNNP